MARERIQKAIANAGIASRRGGEDLVRAGRVTVDGRAAIIGEQVDPAMQRVEVDGRPLPGVLAPRSYWVLNKPSGVVSTVRDRHAERTVMDFLPPETRRTSRLYPVGRLDEESEGLLLFTDDGAWAELLLHPRFGVEREYMVGLEHSVTKQQKAALRTGIELEEGLAKLDHLDDLTPAQIRNLSLLLEPPHPEFRWYRVVLAQGWKRQIRRMFDAVGMPVQRLVRIRVGSLKLVDLPAGQVRRLTHQEVTQLASCARAQTTTRPEKAPAADSAPVAARTFTKRRLPPAVAIDGPSSSGKSTVGAEAARQLSYRFCDTGLLYRAVAWLALQRGIAPTDIEALVPLAGEVSLVADGRGRLRHVHADGRDVTSSVAAAEVDRAVSDYAKVPELREAMVPRQRALAKGGGIIIAGRDIGTVILPDADVKIYLNASAEVRARRRADQRSTTDAAEAEQILSELRRRDSIDSNRETAPLKTAADAVVINTDGITFQETVTAVVDAIRAATGANGTGTGTTRAARGAASGH
ncbi:MAG TPA: (d)CMP kinase [Candidatus Limnocylindrales bacterium]